MRILLIIYDNDSFIHWFPQGMAYIAAILKKNGNQVEIYNQRTVDCANNQPDQNRHEQSNNRISAVIHQIRKEVG